MSVRVMKTQVRLCDENEDVALSAFSAWLVGPECERKQVPSLDYTKKIR